MLTREEQIEEFILGELEVSGVRLTKTSKSFMINCPFHGDLIPSLSVRRDGTGFKCFGCGVEGNWNYIARKLGVREAFWTGLQVPTWGEMESLKERVLAVQERPPAKTQEFQSSPLPREFIPCFDRKRWRVPKYLSERGISRKTIRVFQIGFCNAGRYAGHIIIPVICGDLHGFVSRSTFNADKLGPKGFSRYAALLGYHLLKREEERVVIVEGPFDLFRVYQTGFRGVALLGKQMTREKLRRIRELEPKEVVVLLDSAEWESSQDVAQELIRVGVPTRIALLPPEYKDPDLAPADVLSSVIQGAYEFTGLPSPSMLLDRLSKLV